MCQCRVLPGHERPLHGFVANELQSLRQIASRLQATASRTPGPTAFNSSQAIGNLAQGLETASFTIFPAQQRYSCKVGTRSPLPSFQLCGCEHVSIPFAAHTGHSAEPVTKSSVNDSTTWRQSWGRARPLCSKPDAKKKALAILKQAMMLRINVAMPLISGGEITMA
jgi:hypothetical protein